MRRASIAAALVAALALGAAAQSNSTTTAPAPTAPPAPTLYWNDHGPAPLFVHAPLRSMHFGWSIRWDATNTTAWVVGTFNYSSDHGYVGIGTNSADGMDGLNIICHAKGSGVDCDDWVGDLYAIHEATNSLTAVLSYRLVPGAVSQVVFERIAFQNGRDLGLFTWGTAKRVIWAYGPLEGGEPAAHPGEGIASGLLDFLTGEHPDKPNPGTHLLPCWVALGVLALTIIIAQVTVAARIPVHHYVREGFGWGVAAVFVGLFVWYVVASINDYTAIAVLEPVARGMGDTKFAIHHHSEVFDV
jgi:hypothetical protein